MTQITAMPALQSSLFTFASRNLSNTVLISLATSLQCCLSYHLIPCELDESFTSALNFVYQVTALFRPSVFAILQFALVPRGIKTIFYRAASALTYVTLSVYRQTLGPIQIAILRAGLVFSWRTISRALSLQGTEVVRTAVVIRDSKTTRPGSRRRYDSVYLCGLSGEATGTLASRYDNR